MSDTLASIRARRAEIARTIALLQSEDEELATTESVLQRFTASSAPDAESDGRQTLRKGPRPRSQREFVLEILASSETPCLRANEIIRQVKARWGVAIPEPSLRPLLSVMKQKKLIVRHGRLVALRERAVNAARAVARHET
jgi:hypothetical protein